MIHGAAIASIGVNGSPAFIFRHVPRKKSRTSSRVGVNMGRPELDRQARQSIGRDRSHAAYHECFECLA